MSKKTCIKCGKIKKFLSPNYAGLKLDKNKKSYPFLTRITPRETPGDAKSDYLCEECVNSIVVTCDEHGEIKDKTWKNGNPPKCLKCKEEYNRFGAPPTFYQSIEAFECQGTSGSFQGDLGLQQQILLSHPCKCGGKWKLLVGNSPMPSGIADNGYVCESCGYYKWFRFRLWETGAPFPRAR